MDQLEQICGEGALGGEDGVSCGEATDPTGPEVDVSEAFAGAGGAAGGTGSDSPCSGGGAAAHAAVAVAVTFEAAGGETSGMFSTAR